MDLPPLVELLYAAHRVYGYNADEAMEIPPYSWLLRARTLVWYLEGLGASPRFRESREEHRTNSVEAMMG